MSNKIIKMIDISCTVLFLVIFLKVMYNDYPKYKDYQIDVHNNNVILYDNGNIVSKGKLDSLPQMIINDNL